MFISCGNDRINTAEIVTLREDQAELRDGSIIRLKPDQATNIALATSPIIPAQPGFELLDVFLDDPDEIYFARQPIIGWRLEPCCPRPLVVDNYHLEMANDGHRWAVKYPDGQVAGEPVYENEAAWRAAMEKEHRERHQQAAE